MPGASRRRRFLDAVPFLAPPEPLGDGQRRLLLVLGATVMINHYDFGLLSLVLSHLQADLVIPESELGPMVSVIRLGALPSVLLALVADRVGRRRLLVGTLLAFTACTAATAFARTAFEFMALQFLARVFVTAEEFIAVVIVAEELGARSRGYGLGVLAALGSLGNGVSALAFGAIDLIPHGWRALYLLGAAPLLLLAWIRRTIPETRRFEAHAEAASAGRAAAGGGLGAWFGPALELGRRYPGRMAVLVAAIVPATVVMTSAGTFVPKTLLERHGFGPGDITTLYLTVGVFVLLGNVVAGRLADRVGRRAVVATALVVNAAGIWGFYNLAMPWVVVAWVAMMFCLVAVDVLFGALGSELFPTAFRSTASSIRALAWTLGGSIGLLIEGALFGVVGDTHGEVLTVMLPVALLAPLVIWFGLPETAARELEDIAPDVAPG
ncbi:MAG TPA: MFS transporter [Myxococcota bacterium]|nr:MFS transporter [Myxococcota bacterium]